MRTLLLAKSGHNKIKSHQKELKASDLEDSVRPLPPGEWCFLQLKGAAGEVWPAFVNAMIDEKFPCVQVLGQLSGHEARAFSPETFIAEKLKIAFQRRKLFKGYAEGCRMFYGASDGLPGLIIDIFANAVIIQINTAGLDRSREFIRKMAADLTGIRAFFLDNPKYREKEFLPTYEIEKLPDLVVRENGLTYSLSSDIIQKVGFYYDHRENRLQLRSLLARLERSPENGVDLFSYAGSWGLNALKAGVGRMDFVDQGDFGPAVQKALAENNLTDRGAFHRADVFKFLDESASAGKTYDLVLCDPPAFAKSPLQKSQALEGYSKLHRRVFKVAAPGAVCAFSSCTHYVGHDEFQKNVLDASYKEDRKVQLLYCGMQGWDHPVSSLDDRANYIKSYIYILE